MKMDRQEKWIAFLWAVMLGIAVYNIDKFFVVQ